MLRASLAIWSVLLGAASAAPLRDPSHFRGRTHSPACIVNASTVAGRSLSGEVCRAAFRSPCGAMPFVSTPLLTSGLVATRVAVAGATAGHRNRASGRVSPLRVRGGAFEDDDDDDDDADDFDDDDEAYGGASEGDFEGEDSAVAKVRRIWRATPPVTQCYVGASMALTAAAFALNGNAWPRLLELEWKPTLMRLQLWRPLTAFLFLGKLDLYYGFTLQFVWM